MKDIIKLENGQEITLDNNLAWLMEYQNQFGEDILPSLMPLIMSLSDMIGSIAESKDIDFDNIRAQDLLKVLRMEETMDAWIKLSAFKTTDIINIIWALAKAADGSIDPPIKWIRQFEDGFPIDIILPKAAKLVVKGVMSSKNVERLTAAWTKLQPKKPKKKQK